MSTGAPRTTDPVLRDVTVQLYRSLAFKSREREIELEIDRYQEGNAAGHGMRRGRPAAEGRQPQRAGKRERQQSKDIKADARQHDRQQASGATAPVPYLLPQEARGSTAPRGQIDGWPRHPGQDRENFLIVQWCSDASLDGKQSCNCLLSRNVIILLQLAGGGDGTQHGKRHQRR